MVNYPDLSNLSSGSGIGELLALPNASWVYFWTTILGGLFLILTMALYYGEKTLKGKGNILSSAGVSSLACIVLATFGSYLGIFTVTTLVPVIVFGLVIIAVWIITGK